MNKLYRIFIFMLVVSVTACVSSQTNMANAGNDEDKDIGLGGTGIITNTDNGTGMGGTGIVADTDSGTGMGGTGIVGEITGFGSIFVNGIEIEYDNKTTFTIDGKTAAAQQLEIGDVVEVLTTDDKQYTQAREINLRHEVIGKVESVEPQAFSFAIRGQTVIQGINKGSLPEVGTTVAVSGFRIDKKTILSTRVTPADTKQTLLRTHTELPFKGKTSRWLIQTHVRNDNARFKMAGKTYNLAIKEKPNKSIEDQLGIRILQLKSTKPNRLELDRAFDSVDVPRGKSMPVPTQRSGNFTIQKSAPGTSTGTTPGSGDIKTNGGTKSQPKTPQVKQQKFGK
jgi:hypothetical protein